MGVDVSVVIPAYNEANYIARALASVAAQAWPVDRVEAVVVNNGSTDETSQVVRRLLPTLPIPVQLIDVPWRGRSRAKNLGAEHAHGTILVFLDADSALAPHLVPSIVAAVHAGYPAGSIAVLADETSDPLDRAFFRLIEFGKRQFAIYAQMLFCTRACFLSHRGFDARLELAEDREILVRLQRSGVPLCHLTTTWIVTSPRRLHRWPLHLGMVAMFARWALGHIGIGRSWRY